MVGNVVMHEWYVGRKPNWPRMEGYWPLRLALTSRIQLLNSRALEQKVELHSTSDLFQAPHCLPLVHSPFHVLVQVSELAVQHFVRPLCPILFTVKEAEHRLRTSLPHPSRAPHQSSSKTTRRRPPEIAASPSSPQVTN